jgi:mono/diheme cytochrome c family protein
VAAERDASLNEDDRLIYRGRIDDRFESIGRLRRVIRSHDLLEAFKVAHEPEAEARTTAPVSCYFEAWENVGDREVTYARDIEPILAANCAECHQAGGVAPFALGHYRQASGRARMLAHVTGEGLMPPGRAVPRFGRFRDERYLSQTQIDLFAAWAAGGAAEGLPADRAPAARLPSRASTIPIG